MSQRDIIRAKIATQVEIDRKNASEEVELQKESSAKKECEISQALDSFAKLMLQGLVVPPSQKQLSISPKDAKSIHRAFCQLLQKGLSPDKFSIQMFNLYREYQDEHREARCSWQNEFSYWDPSPMQIDAIKDWTDSLPKSTIFVSPASGKGLFEACIQVSVGISVRCNDLKKQERSFVSEIQQMDAIDFLNQTAEEEEPIAIIASWLPGKRDANSKLSEEIFRWAHDPRNNVVAIIHISEVHDTPTGKMVACTDTVAAVNFKQANFTTMVELPREYPAPWESHYGLPINDSLTIVIPNKNK